MAIRVQIDGYDSLEQIGVGGMAAVYKARKISIDKTVAIKVLFPYLATDASFKERFQREAKAAASIQHENIVNVIDFGESEGSFFIVMEYYQGRTLEDLMKERAGVPFDVATQIILEVAFGLEAAHHLDIVHRDVKPANIIFTDQGGIKVADFGLAKKSDSVTMITQLGKVIGTPAYMSPEQAAGRPVGTASDIFSLGVVAYELFGRRKPFEGKTYSDVLEKIQTYAPPSVIQVNPVIEPDFAAIVSRMLQKNDRDRYPNATALISDLEAAMEKAKISRDRRRLGSYIKNPDAYDAAVLEKTVANCLSRGTFYLQKGQHHLDDAALEFRRILFLDPNNERARKNLDRIKSQQGGASRTVTIEAATPATASAATTSRVAPVRAGKAIRPARSRRRWVVGVGGVALTVALALGAWFGSRAFDGATARDTAPSSASMSDRPTDGISIATREPEGSLVGTPSDSAADTARVVIGSDKPKRGVQSMDTVQPATPTRRDEKATGIQKDAPLSTTTVASRDAAKSTRTPIEKPAEPRATGENGTKPAISESDAVNGGGEEAKRPARDNPAVAKPADGTLSVYFLGGVGEFFVNGKRFAQQPPFDKVSLPAGSYRMACRMSGDAAPKEIVVTIRPNQETIIEYELGQDPVVATE
ncbi:MAG TPA: protein kinase [Candidatus Krumholzibacteria bacterium]|nr:protein kinase [Candidatus Krumholzibacteria bacterium]